MVYRELGSTGIRVSEIGMGCEGKRRRNYLEKQRPAIFLPEESHR